MKHRVYGKHLSRNKDERDRLFKGLASELFLYGTIQTSLSKAKAIKGLIDRIINLAKKKEKQYLLQSFLEDIDLKKRLIKEIVPKMGSRNSGYTKLVRLGTRLGDQTMMVRMSLIGAEELKPIKTEVPKFEKVSKVSKVKSKKVAKTDKNRGIAKTRRVKRRR